MNIFNFFHRQMLLYNLSGHSSRCLWHDVTYDVIVCVYKNTDSLQNYVIQVLKVKMPIDIELFIELYRSKEGLWDSGNANYLNMDVMQAVLRRIAGRLGSEVTGGIKSTILCCFIRSEKGNIAIKCTMNITAQIYISAVLQRGNVHSF